MKNRFAVLLSLAAISALAVAGCGGSDDNSDAPTKAEFITQADEICQTASDNLTEAQGELNEDSTKDDYIAFISDTYLPELKEEVGKIKDLTPPDGDEGTIDELIASLDDGIDEMESDPGALLEEGSDPLDQATVQAQDYGLKVCGQG
ncbi:MAG: hypothetical protein WBP55_05880 [Solirubrobacterales bacterium]